MVGRLTHFQWKLDERKSMTLDSSGSAQGLLAPGGAREKWVINFMTVSTANTIANSPNVPQMIVYRQAPIPGNQLGGTFSALLDTNTDTFLLNMNEGLYFVVTVGDVGSVVTVHIEGIRHVWGT